MRDIVVIQLPQKAFRPGRNENEGINPLAKPDDPAGLDKPQKLSR